MINMWDLESLVKIKEKLKNTLIDRHIEVNEEDTLSDLVDKVAKIGEETLLYKVITDSNIKELICDKIDFIKPYGFAYDYSLKKINFRNIKGIGGCAFYKSGLTEFVSYDKAMLTGTQIYSENQALKRVIAPFFMAGVAPSSMFYNDQNLKLIDIGDLRGSLTYTFGFCYALTALILRANSLNSLQSIDTFASTPFRLNTGGYIYIPKDLVDLYKKATNWTIVANRIVPLEGTIYEDPYWSKKENTYIYVDSVEYELPKDTTVLQFKNTYQIENMYSDGQVMNDENVLYDFKDAEITTEVK